MNIVHAPERIELRESRAIPPVPSRRRLSWKVGLGLGLFGILLACLMLEVGLRIVSSLQTSRAREVAATQQAPAGEYWAIYDPDLGYRLNPKFGDYNSDGLRDHPIAPKDGRPRLVFLGDSIAQYGDDVDDTFVGHLRSELHQEPAFERLDVINAGIKGYTNYQELLYLKKYGLAFGPDLVGVQFCLNDLHKFLHSFRIEDRQIVPDTYQFSSEAMVDRRDWLRRLLDKSRLLVWAENNLRVAAKALQWKIDDGFSFDYAVDFSNAWRDEPWKDIESQFGEMVELGRQNNFRVFIVVVPTGEQYNASYLARDRNYVLKPQRKLKEIAERLSIPFYDLYPDLKAGMFVDGIHLTKEGREVVGQRVAAFLTQSQLLPTEAGARGMPR